MSDSNINRRELRTRRLIIFHRLSRLLAAIGMTPDQISCLSVIFAVCAGATLYFAAACVEPRWCALLFFAAAVSIQLRLLCNLLDGLMAIEGEKKSIYGELYNEIPDRLADVTVFIGAGYGLNERLPGAAGLGWAVALAAVLTAYVRLVGASCGAPQYFSGPMAKQHRMFLMTVASLVSCAEVFYHHQIYALTGTLILILIGCLLTCARRTHFIVKFIQSRN